MEVQLLRNMIDGVANDLSEAAERLAGTQPEMAYLLNALAGTARTLAEGVVAYHRDLFASGKDAVYLALNLARVMEGRQPMDFAAPFELAPCNSGRDQQELACLLAKLRDKIAGGPVSPSRVVACGAVGQAFIRDGRLVVEGRYNIRAGFAASVALQGGAIALELSDYAAANGRHFGEKPKGWVMPLDTAGAVQLLIAGALALLGKEAWA